MPDPSTFREPQGRPERVEGRAESRVDWRSHIRSRLLSLGLSPARENEIVEELSQHLDDRWRELIAAAFIATVLPARGAASIDPIEALRSE